MKIKKAVFAGSCASVKDKPKEKLPEFAFIGRSNVGKSSLINMLCGMNKLAHTSSTPGKTVCINHFMINDSWFLVDLPGYGYAKLSGSIREKLADMNNGYITGSEELVLLFVLLDSRLPLQKIDLDFLNGLGEAGVPFSIIFTKSDKSGKDKLEKAIELNKKELYKYWEELPEIFISSAKDKTGREEILKYIGTIINTLKI
ncbi:MAG: ribosome biogenesis GTP-binding protein YihA/YsxC [Bacteroidales bacterium]|jgi:GTP-binding protein|nr:ribosome biogenesis GTP-binding protein YihA/YsxC [Bacteroidales bacterium]